MNWKRIITMWVVIFGIFLIISNVFTKSKTPGGAEEGDIVLQASKETYAEGEEVIIKIKNNTASAAVIPLGCPKNPLAVSILKGEAWVAREAEAKISCDTLKELTVAPGKTGNVTFAYWNHALFTETGTYRIETVLTVNGEEKKFSTDPFAIEETGIFRKAWRTALYRPILNLLVFLTITIPGKSLGLGIILVTLIIRLILLVPSQRSIQSQKKLQGVQPKLEEIKKKYAGNQERIAQETMEIWKREKVNPFGSCLPLIPQTFVLIALYYVIRNGLNPDNAYLLYGTLKNVDFTVIKTNFLGMLELTKINAIFLPLAIGFLQYFQMKMTMAKKSAAAAGEKGSEMQMANSMMVYFMPVMIAIFTASVPAGVGLYWGVSTVFGIGQQLYANAQEKKKTMFRSDLQ